MLIVSYEGKDYALRFEHIYEEFKDKSGEIQKVPTRTICKLLSGEPGSRFENMAVIAESVSQVAKSKKTGKLLDNPNKATGRETAMKSLFSKFRPSHELKNKLNQAYYSKSKSNSRHRLEVAMKNYLKTSSTNDRETLIKLIET